MLVKEKKEILVLGEGPTNGLDNITITPKTNYSVNITNSRKKIYLSLRYNAANSFLHANNVNIHQFKANDSQTSHCDWGIFQKTLQRNF